ncbi:DUF4157 domain-containing protein [filamentous cyanobacterium LEGE 11480]|uniref:DUF4157 domain-containing protein n=1 Tax=Romeriopsis navalis LEGE 11480 TaxID=2777977 RepID=A0A928Z5P5_9CYAN|nr:DUF4157 domain-containing protein [Romeriopsis navalis]MBE9031490.1 DUF4157 domain-containing protein [Romeriopsis navalis LEGE 11480]
MGGRSHSYQRRPAGDAGRVTARIQKQETRRAVGRGVVQRKAQTASRSRTNVTEPRVQAKLKVGAPNDRYEQAADQAADRVMSMPDPALVQREPEGEDEGAKVAPKLLQREADEEQQEIEAAPDISGKLIQREPDEADESAPEVSGKFIQRVADEPSPDDDAPTVSAKLIQREVDGAEADDDTAVQRQAAGQAPAVSAGLEARLQSSKSGGSGLPDSVQRFMEPRFGADFGGVRVHTDSNAVQMSRELGAKAFTHGNHIYYGAGYAPANDHLTAHEIEHTVQQAGKKIRRKPHKFQRPKIQMKVASADQATKTKESPKFLDVQPQKATSAKQISGQEKNQPISPKESSDKTLTGAESKANAEAKVEMPSAAGSIRKSAPAKTAKTKVSGRANVAPAVTAGVGSGKTGVTNSTAPAKVGNVPQSVQTDPDFQSAVSQTKAAGAAGKQHAPAGTKAQEAQEAAVSPPAEQTGKAQANQVGEMQQAETPGFNKAAFKQQLMEKIKASAPKTLSDADKFKENNKLGAVKSEMTGKVKDEKSASQQPLEEKTKKAPDTSGIPAKPVTPLAGAEKVKPVASVGAEKAVPKARSQAEVEAPLQQEAQKADQQMASADVTEEQLAKSNEPEFKSALTAKQAAKDNAAGAPAGFRAEEKGELTQAQTEAGAMSQQKLQGMQGDRAQLMAQVAGQQTAAKGQDEQARAKVAADIQGIYDATKGKVETILSGLDSKVTAKFDAGSAKAQKTFEEYVGKRMKAYKAERYSGLLGKGKWVKDKLFGMPSDVNAFYQEGRNLYIQQMGGVIDQVVNLIAGELSRAKTEVAKGRQKVQAYLAKQPEDLKAVAKEAAGKIQGQFDSLEQSVDAKQDELIDTLATKYNEKLKSVDARITKLKSANKGLVDKAIGAITGVIATINKLKNMLLSVLKGAASAITGIIKDPIGFLGNLIGGIKKGFDSFVGNIMTHLQGGLIGWLTGALGGIGIQLPKDIFSLPGIFDLAMQVLGMSWDYVRTKAVKLMGEPVVKAAEKTFEVFTLLQEKGPLGLWGYVKEQFSDLKEQVLGEIKNMVITQVIQAGVKWILGLLNPASAFVKACMLIYDVVMFFVNQGSQVLGLMKAVVDGVKAIASGSTDAVAKAIEGALVKSLPVVIGFMASLLGIGGLTGKVQKIIKKVRGRIDKAIDKILLKIKKQAKKITGSLKKKGEKIIGKLFKWSGFKKKFRTKDGEQHKLFFKGEGKQAKLTVASKEQEVKTFLDQKAEIGDDQNKKAALVRAKQSVTEVYSKKGQLSSLEERYAAAVAPGPKVPAIQLSKLKGEIKALIASISAHFENLKNDLVVIGIVDQSPDTLQSQVTSNSATHPTKAIAEPLTALAGNTRGSNSTSRVKLPAWHYLDQIDHLNRGNDGSIYNEFKRMHLIHEKMHGPANKSNLVAGDAKANKDHYENVEAKILTKLYQPGTIMWYEVEVEYHPSPHQNFGHLFKCKWGKMKWDSGKAVRDGQLGTYPVISRAPETLKTSASGLSTKIHGKGRKKLMSILLFSKDRAKRIAAACTKYENLDVYAAMDQYYSDPNNLYAINRKKVPYSMYLDGDKNYIQQKIDQKPNGYTIDLTT